MDRPMMIYPGYRLGLPALLLLACGLQAQAEPAPAPGAVPTASALAAAWAAPKPAAAKPRPAKPRKPQPRRYSKATLNAYQPDPAQLMLQSDTAPPAAPGPAAAGDQIPAVAAPDDPLSKLLEADQPTRPAGNKHRPLPAQEEAQALSRAAALPDEQTREDPAQSEKAEGKVEQGLETGPMRLQVRKQAVQMSVEIPFK